MAGRALGGHPELSFPPGAQVGQWGDDLGDDVAGPLDDDGVPDAEVLPPYVILVVQRGQPHGDAPHLHRLQHGEGIERTGAPHVDADVEEARLGRAGGELAGDGPPRVAGHRPQGGLHGTIVDLDHHAVDVVGQFRPAFLPRVAAGDHLLQCPDQLHPRVHSEAAVPQPLEDLPLAAERVVLHVADSVDPQGERSGGGHPRVELPQGPGGGIARIGEGALSGGDALLVETLEGVRGQVHLPAHLQDRRHAVRVGGGGMDHQRDGGDGPQVLGDVLAHHAVAARGSLDEAPRLVPERHRQAVDLGLQDEARLAGVHAGRLQQSSHPAVPGAQLVVVLGVRQGQHGLQMLHAAEGRQRLRSHPLRGRVGGHQLGMGLLESAELAEELVVGGVGDLGGVEDVVAVVVQPDLVPQLLDPPLDARPAHPSPASNSSRSPARSGIVGTNRSGPSSTRVLRSKTPQPTANAGTPAAFAARTSKGLSPM